MTNEKRIEDYANACLKIRTLMQEATHRRKHKALVPVGDLNDALMAFGITKESCENDLTHKAILVRGRHNFVKMTEQELNTEIRALNNSKNKAINDH